MNQSSEASNNSIAPLTFSVEETGIALGVSKPTVYRLIKRRILRPVPGIRRKRIPRSQVWRYVSEGLPDK
jgi:excisionase family DNA binding protein